MCDGRQMLSGKLRKADSIFEPQDDARGYRTKETEPEIFSVHRELRQDISGSYIQNMEM
jgi:hypothetical protein